MAIAEFIKTISGFNGEAALYKLNPPMTREIYDYEKSEDQKGFKDIEYIEHVIVSAANVFFSGPETYIFPADKDGNILSWGELEGSYKGGLSHTKALFNAGYSIVGIGQPLLENKKD